MRTPGRLPSPRIRAFSLVEALIVLGLIGAFAALAVAYFGRLHGEHFERIRDQRNAQAIVSLIMGATAAGAEVIVPGDMAATVRNLVAGKPGLHGTFKGRTFRLPGLTQEEIAGALPYLVWDNGMVGYDKGQH